MDPRHQNHDNEHNQHNPSISGNYGYNFAQNDTFNSFLPPDQEPAFNAPWDTEAFSNTQEPINTFGQGNPAWQQTSIQPSNLLPGSSQGVQSRPFDRTYSRSPASFSYPGFQSHPGQSLSPPSYGPSLAYGHLPLNEDLQYGYSRPHSQPFQASSNQTQTVSPQALQHYPTSFTQDAQQTRHVSPFFNCVNLEIDLLLNLEQTQQSYLDPALALRGVSSRGSLPPASITRKEWVSMLATIPRGEPRGSFLARAPEEFSNLTNSRHLIGFTFVGTNNIELTTSKGNISESLSCLNNAY